MRGGSGSPRSCSDEILAERDPDDRGHAERLPPRGFEGVDPRTEDGPQRDRDAGRPALDQRDPAVAPLERPVLEERPDRLADEQRVARRPLVDAADPVGLDRGPGDERRQPGGLGLGEALQVDALDVGPVDPGREPGRSRAGEHDQRAVGRGLDEQLDQRDARRIEPVQVVDDDDARPGERQEPVDVPPRDVR